MTVPAEAEYLRVIRLVVDALATAGGFGIDRTDELNLAIDEAASALLELPNMSRLHLSVGRDGQRVLCDLSGDGTIHDGGMRLDPLRARVLETVTDHLTIGPDHARIRLGMDLPADEGRALPPS